MGNKLTIKEKEEENVIKILSKEFEEGGKDVSETVSLKCTTIKEGDIYTCVCDKFHSYNKSNENNLQYEKTQHFTQISKERPNYSNIFETNFPWKNVKR